MKSEENASMFVEAIIAYNIEGDTGLLEEYWRRDGTPPVHVKMLADGMRERLRNRRIRQRGIYCPHVFAAFMAECAIVAWRARNRKKRCPFAVQEAIVHEVADAAAHWAVNRTRRALSTDRILTILREPRGRRLGW